VQATCTYTRSSIVMPAFTRVSFTCSRSNLITSSRLAGGVSGFRINANASRYNVFPERMAPLNGALGLSSGRLIAFRFDEGDACENALCPARLTATTRTASKTVILGFTNDSIRPDGDHLNAFGVGSCLFIFPFRCASSFDNLAAKL